MLDAGPFLICGPASHDGHNARKEADLKFRLTKHAPTAGRVHVALHPATACPSTMPAGKFRSRPISAPTNLARRVPCIADAC
jgi:hypothetical protein